MTTDQFFRNYSHFLRGVTMSSQISDETKPERTPLNLTSAMLSMILPGLGQLAQGRVLAFFEFLMPFLIFASIPFVMAFDAYTMLSQMGQIEKNAIFFFLATALFPLILLCLAVLDAATWKKGESSLVSKPLVKCICCFLFLYLIFLLLLPLNASRGPDRRISCMNNTKNIGLAIINYEAGRGSLPPAYTVDANGKPLHSWRVLILPYIDELGLYKKIRLDEPWDSEYNRQFHDAKIPVFQCPSKGILNALQWNMPQLRAEGNCYYSVVIGDETPFPGEKTTTFDDIKDGTNNTLLVVERLLPVCWMDPNHEIIFDTAAEGVNKNVHGIGSAHAGGCNIGYADGSVHFVSDEIEKEEWKAMLTKAGNDNEKGKSQ